MGKVYDALKRAQNPEDELDLFDEAIEEVEVEAEIPEIDHVESQNQGLQRQHPRKFNFMRYSLGTAATVVHEQPRQQTAGNALAPARSVARPSRELTVIPERIDPHLVAFHNVNRPASQEYNKLALSLISKAAERGFKRVLVASAQAGEGRTCVTLNLACALARARQRVLVVDCDLSKPSVMQRLGLQAEIGMYEAFDRGIPPASAAVSIRPQGFNVLPTTRPLENPAELLAMPGFWKMLQAFDADHDFILFDSSALDSGVDSSLLVRFTDTTLLVVRAGHTASGQLAKALTPLAQDDILGVVINRVSR
jgi:Mrp family chromosome partitioning ATPase